jgi:hypothetical protein
VPASFASIRDRIFFSGNGAGATFGGVGGRIFVVGDSSPGDAGGAGVFVGDRAGGLLGTE